MQADALGSRDNLRADCSRCSGLCCVALGFRASSEFAADKESGVACPNLVDGQGCGIHHRLHASGYRGCAAFDCFGAGQRLTEITFAGRNWRESPQTTAAVFAAFEVMRRLKELLWHLADAARAARAPDSRREVGELARTVQGLTELGAGELEQLDVEAIQKQAMAILAQVSAARRASVADACGLELAAKDLSGADLADTNLRGANLRHARLSGAVLTGADLTGADLFGADLRDADLSRARLEDCLYLTPMQLEVAIGDGKTTVPPGLRPPSHWQRAGG